MPKTRVAITITVLSACLVVLGLFTLACNSAGSPTEPTPPPTSASGAAAGTNVVISPGTHIDIEKATNGEDADEAIGPQIPVGDPVTWTYVVTNTGSLPLIGIEVTDDKLFKIECPKKTLASGHTMTCTAMGTAEAGQYRNVATATGTTSQGQTATDEDASHYFGIVSGVPSILLEKATNGEDADDLPGPEIVVGDTVTWSYVVTNTGDVPFVEVTVTDEPPAVILCPKLTLAAGETMTCTAEGEAVLGQYSNLGKVVGKTAADAEVEDDDPSHYLGVAPMPAIDIEKSTNGADADQPAGPVVRVGDAVLFTYEVTNTGRVLLTNVVVTDDQPVVVTCPQTELAVGAGMTCTAAGVATEGQYVNVGTASGTGPGGTVVTDEDLSHYFGIVEVEGDLACGHGYWKNHLDSWAPTPYTPDDLVGSVFASTLAYPFIAESTFLEALEFPGGPGVDGAIRIVMRQAIAALLNATHPDLASPNTVAEIIEMVNAAIDTGDRQTILALNGKLLADNEAGCSLE